LLSVFTLEGIVILQDKRGHNPMVLATNLGYPRIGAQRQLKKALEAFWSGKITATELQSRATELRKQHWQLQHTLGLNHVPANDFSLYDHILDTIALVGAIPERYAWSGTMVDLSTYFMMARGTKAVTAGDTALPAMEMTKWFDTNYHYIVPELTPDQRFSLSSTKPLDEFLEAKALGIYARPVLPGPLTFLLLSKSHTGTLHLPSLLERLLPVYEELLQQLAAAGVEWVQLDEPCLVLRLDDEIRKLYHAIYTRLSKASPRILLATYFGPLHENLQTALNLPVAALHLDLVRAPEQLQQALTDIPSTLSLSLGLVDGRNIWRTDLDRALQYAERAVQALGSDRVMLAPSCSLLHVPMDLEQEPDIDAEIRPWLAFARQKVEELVVLTRALNEGRPAVETELATSREAIQQRRASSRVSNPAVARRVATALQQSAQRTSPFAVRKAKQQERLQLPLLPTTTIGSFPQTSEVRAARQAHKKGKLNTQDYETFLRHQIEETIRFQEDIGIDVLVHGEFERTDMVEYFGEHLQGILITANAWVQSYGSRCVRPPIIYGDVVHTSPITVRWITYAQALTEKPLKAILTGPVTMLQWSFVRDDQPRAETCYQLALAIRDEVQALEEAGIQIIQIDEPALREGTPLRVEERERYFEWAIHSFRLASTGVKDETQIHSHMCYSEFNDILDAIASMDVDVLSIEASRSQLELLNAFATCRYLNDIGPGIYDIHSPRVPEQKELDETLQAILQVLPAHQLWVNPDCGLKTRRWEEVRPSLTRMVEAARRFRHTSQQKEKQG